MANYAKRALKRLRVSQPLNYLLTSTARGLLRATGWRSEFFIKHLHRAGIAECDLPNGKTLKLWSRGDDWVSTQIFWRGLQGYEPETALLFLQLAATSSVTLDIGAYVGFYTLLAAQANPAGRVFAFEPLPYVYGRLQKNVALNKLSNVECVRAAVSDQNGQAEFYTTGSLPTSSSLSFEFMKNGHDLDKLLVEVITVDAFVKAKQLAVVNLIKIDTESTEPLVLKGMEQTIRLHRPSIVCEVLKGRGSERAIEEFFRPLDYQFYLLTAEGAILQKKLECHPEWLNYLFMPSGRENVVSGTALGKGDSIDL